MSEFVLHIYILSINLKKKKQTNEQTNKRGYNIFKKRNKKRVSIKWVLKIKDAN